MQTIDLQMSLGVKLPSGFLVCASVCGPKHLKDQTASQDYWAFETNGDKVVAVISDGAGSAPDSRIGASVCCRMVVKTLAKFIVDNRNLELTEVHNFIEPIEHAINRSRTILLRLAKAENKELRNFHATLLGVIASPEGGCFFHIGDGVGLVCSEANKLIHFDISRPENGEFANETFFYTENDWQNHLRLKTFTNQQLIALMTDGVDGFMFDSEYKNLDQGFLPPVLSHLENHEPQIGASDLAETLVSTQAILVPDDKTIVLIKWGDKV